MAVEINWTSLALDDMANIAEFISKDSLHYAQVQTERFFARAEILHKHPRFGRVVPEFMKEEIRELHEGNYRVVYRIVSENQIDILTIHHARKLLVADPSK